jgi:class 3 adenylate cyclase
VLASAATIERLEGAVDSRPVGMRALKGKDEGVDVYELVSSNA